LPAFVKNSRVDKTGYKKEGEKKYINPSISKTAVTERLLYDYHSSNKKQIFQP
jgi:hypothetical protein